ncbi:methyltransferase domain-containing protein [Cladochytrium replicatum]|nr:methyltransferase domain-containing protein [Cladochytrium replicatum]
MSFSNILELPEGFACPQEYACRLAEWISDYTWVYNHHAVDFFTNPFWTNSARAEIAESWRAGILRGRREVPPGPEEDEVHDSLLRLATYSEVKDHWPDSLKAFVKGAFDMALPRDYRDIPDVYQALSTKAKPLDNRLVSGMSPKKRHEVQSLAYLIHSIAESMDINHILDMGAGQGYCDVVVAHQYFQARTENRKETYTVIGVDSSEIQTCGAKDRTAEIEARISKLKAKQKKTGIIEDEPSLIEGRVLHVNRRIEPHEILNDVLTEAIGEKADANDCDRLKPSGWVLCGLHACGDLSPTLIRHFLAMPDAKALVVVGCCYNAITEPPDDNLSVESCSGYGYPMSAFLKNLDSSTTFRPSKLGYTARMLACQATSRWIKDADMSVDNFHKHFYRAVLQVVVPRTIESPKLPEYIRGFLRVPANIIVGRLPRGAFSTFITYSRAALDRIFTAAANGRSDQVVQSSEIVSDEELQSVHDEYRARLVEISILWTIRAKLASTIESLILMDRYIYLLESGGTGNCKCERCKTSASSSLPPLDISLCPIFDPVDSPRNMAIIAKKL